MSSDDVTRTTLPRPRARILRADEVGAWQDGYAFIEQAKAEAQKLNDAAKRAYAAEYAQGYKDGRTQGETDAARLVVDTSVKVDRYLAGLETEVAGLALDVVRRVLGQFDVGTLVAKAARQAISEVRRAKYLKFRVHPQSVGRMRDELSAILADGDLGMSLEIDADDTLAPGACILSTDMAVIDAGIEAQLEAIGAAIASRSQEAL
ncbi:MAG TPA: type III secretion system stator protein SctL [Mesorhizobium sp.]|jgi:type III secretion protein L|uniref:type III secretion system stator protein SctL n=1 Tax=Mesorhizobium sp. TaxID=1871066 RepID=UPI002DDD0821|nr:type III secretion system stator protein SctL [Mesorhizobium sp.]HEV2503941.1 type III secretion system stator protein SctL [Mesorhizobium sp.]